MSDRCKLWQRQQRFNQIFDFHCNYDKKWPHATWCMFQQFKDTFQVQKFSFYVALVQRQFIYHWIMVRGVFHALSIRLQSSLQPRKLQLNRKHLSTLFHKCTFNVQDKKNTYPINKMKRNNENQIFFLLFFSVLLSLISLSLFLFLFLLTHSHVQYGY